jgi:hypothetical protein
MIPVDGTRSNRFGNFLEPARSRVETGEVPPRRPLIMRRSWWDAPGIAPWSLMARRLVRNPIGSPAHRLPRRARMANRLFWRTAAGTLTSSSGKHRTSFAGRSRPTHREPVQASRTSWVTARFATPARTWGRSHRQSSLVASGTTQVRRARCRSATPRKEVSFSSIWVGRS